MTPRSAQQWATHASHHAKKVARWCEASHHTRVIWFSTSDRLFWMMENKLVWRWWLDMNFIMNRLILFSGTRKIANNERQEKFWFSICFTGCVTVLSSLARVQLKACHKIQMTVFRSQGMMWKTAETREKAFLAMALVSRWLGQPSSITFNSTLRRESLMLLNGVLGNSSYEFHF